MNEESKSRDAARVRRLLLASIGWKLFLIVATVVFFRQFAPDRKWWTLLGLAVPFAFDIGRSALALATRNHELGGSTADLLRRLRLSNVGFPVILTLLACLAVWSPLFKPYVSSYSRDDYVSAMRKLDDAPAGINRFYALSDAAKTSVFFGSLVNARKYATELLEEAGRPAESMNDGNAIHDGHVVLGLIALRESRLADAKTELLLAGGTKGSPNLDTFGPNMMLAKELLEHHEDATVLSYFELCGRFWTHHDKLARWSEDVRAGRTPDFGANLIF